ncbi:MAG: outer membrane beta-barrel protein [Bacteroidaceae bacterium]|nr:outer membrane beta-barrel protein [Bacteroidaceae bacterium]
MKTRLILWLLLGICPGLIWAQKVTVSGVIQDAATEETLPGASVVLLSRKDSVQVVGASTNLEGKFTLPAVKQGNYILRVSFVGYLTQYKNLLLTKKEPTVDVGTLKLEEDSRMLSETEVVAKLAQMEMKADTFIYNADAFRLPEGSNLEELVKKLPGAEVDDDGTIRINGKTVSKIMVEGKDYFEGDTKMAMKNFSSKLIKKLKAYDRKSDYTRITGIDDGEEQTVLDLTVQKGAKEGWLINTDLAYGTEDRYATSMGIQRFMDNYRVSLLGSANNTNDRGYGGGGGRGGWGGGGIVKSQMAGIDAVWENGKQEYTDGFMRVGGNVRWNHSSSNSLSKSNSEMFLDNVHSTFSNSMNQSENNRMNVGSRLRFQWMIDSLTHFSFNPSFNISKSDSHGANRSVTFNSDPYEFFQNPLEEYDLAGNVAIRDSITVNGSNRTNKSDGNNRNAEFRTQLNRRLGKPGRNITLDGGASYSKSENTSFSRNEISYFQQNRNDFTNQYNLSPSTGYDWRTRLSYSEPIIGALNIQFNYQYQYRYSDGDRSMYSIDSLLTKFPGNYTAEQLYLGYLPGLDSLDYVRNLENSQYATYRENNHEANVWLRYNVGENRVNIGVSFQPQTTHMDYAKNLLDTTVVRHTFNWAPRIDYRWKFSNTGQLRVRLFGWMQQPGITSLLEVTDSSDPLNVSTGNSGLRSSWNNNMNVEYNDYIPARQMGWHANAWFSHTKNSISSATIYNTETGARYTRPMNIDGNWNTSGNMGFNTALGSKKAFNFNTNMDVGYSHNVGYMSSNSDGSNWGNIYKPDGSVNMDYIFSIVALQKSTSKNTNFGDWTRINYRNDLLEVGVNGSVRYSHARNNVQKNANLDSWNFSYGGNFQINTPWGMALSTDISQQSRRGYEDASMNTNELIWNMQLSQSFLKGKAATVSLQWFDILRERSNISRNISAYSRSNSWNNAIHSYVMAHFIYRLDLRASKNQNQRDGWGGGWGGRGWGGRGGW